MIIDSDYNTLTIKTHDGQILLRNIDEYNLLKYQDYNGERIITDLADGVNITETFNDGIFNVTYKDISMQIRDKIELAKRIVYCKNNKTSEPIKELLLKNVESQLKEDILINWLMPFGYRLQIDKEQIIIDDLFKVDTNGQAYYKMPNGEFKRLCIVVGNEGQVKREINHDLGKMNIDFKTMEIYNKVLFLLFPNINDVVFFNQLTPEIKDHVRRVLSEL